MARIIQLCERSVEFPSPQLQPLNDSSHLLAAGDWSGLQAALAADGYLFLRQALSREGVLAARERVLASLREKGHILDPDAPPSSGLLQSRCGLGCLPFMEGKNALTHSPVVQESIAGSTLQHIMDGLLGEPAVTFDYKWLRAMPRKAFTGCHVDRVYMARGSQRLLTCWVPFDDATADLGALALCQGSHCLPGFAALQRTYGEMDTERDHLDGTGWFTTDPWEVSAMDSTCQWRTTDYLAGDIVIFGMRTVHASTANLTDRVRISCDVRWQPASEPVDDRYMGADVSADKRVKSGAWKTDAVDAPLPEVAGAAAAVTKVTIEELKRAWGFAPAATAVS